MDSELTTIQSYNDHANEYALEANERGASRSDIQKIFEFLGKQNPSIVELGCGNGRDAKEFVKRTNRYVGIDASEKLLENARASVPNAEFFQSKFSEVVYPENVDAVVGFASLIHADKDSLKQIMQKASDNLNDKGLVFLTLQQGDYQAHTKTDNMGTRTMYTYTPELVRELKPQNMNVIFEDLRVVRGKKWFAIAMQK